MLEEYHHMVGPLGSEVVKVFGDAGLHYSCLGWGGESKLIGFANQAKRTSVVGKRPVCIEIGTHHGVSSMLLARNGWDVITFDVRKYPLSEKVWKHFGVTDNVTSLLLNGKVLADYLPGIEFSLAFIDGLHKYEAVKSDFEAVKSCGQVIFHDYQLPQHLTRTVRFVDELRVGRTTKVAPFAFWEGPDILHGEWFGMLDDPEEALR